MPSVTLVQITVPCQICSISNNTIFVGGGLTYKLQLPLFEGQESSNLSVWVYIKPGHFQAPELQRHTSSCLPGLWENQVGLGLDWTRISLGKELLNFDFCVYYLIRVLKGQRSLVHSEYCGSLDFVWSLVSSGYCGLLEFSWAYCILDMGRSLGPAWNLDGVTSRTWEGGWATCENSVLHDLRIVANQWRSPSKRGKLLDVYFGGNHSGCSCKQANQAGHAGS